MAESVPTMASIYLQRVFFAFVCLVVPGEVVWAAELMSDPRYGETYAARRMIQLDSDKDGRFQNSENPRLWSGVASADADSDGVITLRELAAFEPVYLKSPGPVKQNLIYKRTTEEDLHLDVYHPAERFTGPRPTVIYTHGGGWVVGSKHNITNGLFSQVYSRLLAKGFCVVAVNYRLYQGGGTITIRDCVVDVKDAARFLAKHSQELGIDPNRFFAHGDSAGGQLAQLLLLSPPDSFVGDPELADFTYDVVAGVSWYGPVDFEKSELFNHDGRPNFRDRFGDRILKRGTSSENKLNRYREVSPVNYLGPQSPPLLLMQGTKDTTIPVHHAHYMTERADAVNAPVEVVLVKNAGHNWREAGGPIKPDRDELVQQTVDFLVARLKPENGVKVSETKPNFEIAETSKPRMPEFSWETIPRYIHVRKTDAFTKEEVKYLASFPLITFEKTTGKDAYGSTEKGTIEAAKAVKALNPAAKTLFYRNVIVHYGGYAFDDRLRRISSPFLVDKAGRQKLVRGRVQAYDLANPEVVDWWVKSMAEVCRHPAIDGLFLDGNVKVLSPYLQNELPQGKKEQVIEGFERMISRTRQELGPDKLMLANILRARFTNGGLEYIDAFDGSYLEGFEHAVGKTSREDYVAKGIETVRKAGQRGKIIALTLNINRGTLDADVDEQSSALKSFKDVSQDRLNYCIALFLIMAEEHSYLNIHDGYDVNRRGDGETVSKLWMQTFPEFQRPLGPPQGPARKNGYRYVREFEHAQVILDLVSERGIVQWK